MSARRFLAAIQRRDDVAPSGAFPWSVPLIRDLQAIEFSTPVTFLVGENGSGKSTVLEGIAAGMSAAAAGSRDLQRDETLVAAREFAKGFRFVRQRHAKTRMFMRAEDAFGFVRRFADEVRVQERMPDSPDKQSEILWAKVNQAAFEVRYGGDLDAQSHGETFLKILAERLAPEGLYFLDEPETPLSPQRLLALMGLIKDRVERGCQFVIATHSPILMGQPDATILSFHDGRIEPVAYDDIEHVRITRAFLNDRERFLRRL
ncbi:MAG: AAA family ATPase [Proteobacteria bacterium]|nr:AAA family ATPase [Pseudomonadota bacterium]MBI3495847.1 AAA family ATPase [Pseudomonadota bacterium]